MSKVYRDVFGNEIPDDPEPVDEQPAAEIRGGNRREDYMPGKPLDLVFDLDTGEIKHALPPGDSFEDGTYDHLMGVDTYAHEDSELEDGAESYGNDPDAQ